MAKSAKTSKSAKSGQRGPAKEVHSGDAKVSRTQAGKPRKAIKGGGAKAALGVPGAVKG